MAGTCTGPGPCVTTPLGTGDNWVTKVQGLPAYIRAIAHALRRNGMDESRAIATAIATCKRWAAGAGDVTAETRARAAKAIAEWEAKKAASHALATPTDGQAVDLAAAMKPLPGTDRPRFPISSHDDVKRAVRAVGRAKGDHAKVRRHIIRRAKAVGAAHLVPSHWKADGTVS